MARYFLPQRDKLEKDEALTPEMISAVNSYTRRMDNTLFQKLGIDTMDPESYSDKPGETPRVFVLKDGKVSTLTENGIKPGSREFWETAMKGQLFGYKLGEKDPVQIQAWMGTAGLDCAISEPLIPGVEASFSEEPEKPKAPVKREPPEPPTPVEKPREVPEPGEEPPRYNIFTRIGAFFGRKASREKIATYNAWSERNEAYENYQTDLEKYEEYQEELETYANNMRRYHSEKNGDRIAETALPGKLAHYERKHKAWEKELADKEQLTQARDQSAKTIADALGATRGKNVLEAEKQEEKEREALFSATSVEQHVERGIENMLSLYGAKPYMKEEWIGRGRYTTETFRELSEIDLTGMTVGQEEPRPITDEDFGALSMFAVVTPENGKALSIDSNPPVVDYPGTVKAFEELGYSEQELGELMANQFVGVVTTDVLRYDEPRNPMTTYIKSYVQPARERTQQALEEYRKGNKQPLADIISRGLEYADQTARLSAEVDTCTSGLLRMAGRMTDMMDRDPALRAMAAASVEKREKAMCGRHREFPAPRTMDDLIGNIKGHGKIQEFREKGAAAQEKLTLAQSGQVTLSEQETKDGLRDVMRQKMVDSAYKTQTGLLIKDSIERMEPVSNAVQKYQTDPDLSMIPRSIEMFVQTRYVDKKPKDNVSMLDMVNQPAVMKALDKGLDGLIDEEIKKDGMSLDRMRDKLLDSGDRTYDGKRLFETMEERLMPAAVKENPEKERQAQTGAKQTEQRSVGKDAEK